MHERLVFRRGVSQNANVDDACEVIESSRNIKMATFCRVGSVIVLYTTNGVA